MIARSLVRSRSSGAAAPGGRLGLPTGAVRTPVDDEHQGEGLTRTTHQGPESVRGDGACSARVFEQSSGAPALDPRPRAAGVPLAISRTGGLRPAPEPATTLPGCRPARGPVTCVRRVGASGATPPRLAALRQGPGGAPAPPPRRAHRLRATWRVPTTGRARDEARVRVRGSPRQRESPPLPTTSSRPPRRPGRGSEMAARPAYEAQAPTPAPHGPFVLAGAKPCPPQHPP